jgi:hypothetical protein
VCVCVAAAGTVLSFPVGWLHLSNSQLRIGVNYLIIVKERFLMKLHQLSDFQHK